MKSTGKASYAPECKDDTPPYPLRLDVHERGSARYVPMVAADRPCNTSLFSCNVYGVEVGSAERLQATERMFYDKVSLAVPIRLY